MHRPRIPRKWQWAMAGRPCFSLFTFYAFAYLWSVRCLVQSLSFPKIKVDWLIFSQNARSLSEIANFHFLVFIGSNGCPRTNKVRFCGKTCSTDGDCRGNRKCLCDGDCGMICVKNSKCIWLYLPIGLWTKISRKQKENSEPTINGRVFFLNLTLRVMYLT